MGRLRLAVLAALAVTVLAPLRAEAGFHAWNIKEVYTNSTGTVQYIELFGLADGQQFLQTHTIVVTATTPAGAWSKTFTFPANAMAGTNADHLLIATPGFTRLAGSVTPDYTLPCGPFIPTDATGNITINFGEGSGDTVVIAASSLPTNGTNSLTDGNASTMGSAANFVSGTSSPTNQVGAAGSVTTTGTTNACDDGNFCNGTETCPANTSACGAGAAPCTKQCIEATDTCVDCVLDGHCNDNNPCTDDDCNGSNMCDYTPHVGGCDDGIFCNGVDVCSGTTCMHPGDPCNGINCNEGPDTCANCSGPADCNDDLPCTVDACTSGQCSNANAADGSECDDDDTFCNGIGMCTSGVCGAIASPCDASTETCDESGDSCTPVGTTPDAPGDTDPPIMGDDDGCCQANVSVGTLSGPAIVLALGMLLGRRRRPTAHR